MFSKVSRKPVQLSKEEIARILQNTQPQGSPASLPVSEANNVDKKNIGVVSSPQPPAAPSSRANWECRRVRCASWHADHASRTCYERINGQECIPCKYISQYVF